MGERELVVVATIMKARDIGNNNCDIQEIEITNIRKVAICRVKLRIIIQRKMLRVGN